MQNNGRNNGQKAANRSDHANGAKEVSICFADPTITYLFSELLQARGVQTQIVEDPASLSDVARVITEPQFFSRVPASARSYCLVVGNKDSLKGLEALQLSRPLTEEKIETALASFLSR